jgi:hypothetical protein
MTQNNFNLDFESFQLLLLEMAQRRSVDELLQLVTSSLASNCNVALARVWMITPGDICNTCNEYAACQDSAMDGAALNFTRNASDVQNKKNATLEICKKCCNLLF